jgi:hypothetical protein
MNAGRDVERLIATWLVEEAPGRAPDRVLDEAAHRIDRTKQQRFAAAWREPMIISTGRLLGVAAVVLVAVVGAGFLGRASAPVGVATSPPPIGSPTASPSTSGGPTLESYRTAHKAVCDNVRATLPNLNDQLAGVYDPNLTKVQRDAKIAVLQQIRDFGQTLRAQLAAIPVPPEMAADAAAYLTRSEDNQAILEQEILLLKAGKLSEAQQVDLLTDPINRMAEQFEQKYGLDPC